jgi:phosphoribosylamine--glycine ligase
MPISGLDEIARQPDLLVFHAGTAHGAASPDQADTQADTQADSAPIVTAGGRVLAVSALGADLPAALERAYAGVAALSFAGMHYRRDIGRQDSQHGP